MIKLVFMFAVSSAIFIFALGIFCFGKPFEERNIESDLWEDR